MTAPFKGMEYTDRSGMSEAELDLLVQDPHWVFQQKLDGTRAMIHLETLAVTSRRGDPLKHTAATQHIPAILGDLGRAGVSGTANRVLDGELLIGTGEFIIFDAIDTQDLTTTLVERIEDMADLANTFLVEGIERVAVVPTARTAGEKRALLRACRDREGIVAKRLNAVYQPGVRTKDVVKVKNVHTADLVVTSKSVGPLSAGLGVYTNRGDLVTVANASLIGKEKDVSIEVGDVVEVSFLYWTGTSVVQPRIVAKRGDKPARACSMDQFSDYSRAIIR